MPKRLINAHGMALENDWQILADDASLPQDPAKQKKILVNLARLEADHNALLDNCAALGVELDNTVDVQAIASLLADCALVALNFPVFSDGRAYSQARLLRERLNFQGEIRACGDVQFDQLFYMARCGFDAFDVPESAVPIASQAFDSFSVAYQLTASGPSVQKAG
jgi:uncharacterized protein (DUF934 family)